VAPARPHVTTEPLAGILCDDQEIEKKEKHTRSTQGIDKTKKKKTQVETAGKEETKRHKWWRRRRRTQTLDTSEWASGTRLRRAQRTTRGTVRRTATQQPRVCVMIALSDSRQHPLTRHPLCAAIELTIVLLEREALKSRIFRSATIG